MREREELCMRRAPWEIAPRRVRCNRHYEMGGKLATHPSRLPRASQPVPYFQCVEEELTRICLRSSESPQILFALKQSVHKNNRTPLSKTVALIGTWGKHLVLIFRSLNSGGRKKMTESWPQSDWEFEFGGITLRRKCCINFNASASDTLYA